MVVIGVGVGVGVAVDASVAIGANVGVGTGVSVAKEIGVEVGDSPGIRVTVGFTIRVEIGVGDSLVSLSLESSTIEYPTISSPKNNRLIEINTTTMSIIPAIYLINYQLKLLIKLSRCNITSFGFSSRHQCPPLEI